jgi:two-component system, NtrC family, nitrogen regulation sensor histidine kinase NtrY
LQNDNSFKRRLLRNSYLLITAAWLITISFIIDNYWSGSSSPEAFQKNISSYIAKQENDFDAIARDTPLINKIANRNYNEVLLKELSEKKYFFFILSENQNGFYDLLFWNTQVVDPTVQIFNMVGKSGFIHLANGQYVWRKNEINGLTVLALIPVRWDYAITNEYLKNNFAIGNGLENNYAISTKPNENSIQSKEGIFLFSLEQKAIIDIPQNTVLASVLRILAVMVIFLLVHIMATYVVHKNFYGGVIFLTGFILLLRVASYYLPIPLNLRQFELFNPNIYGSTPVLRSLGDLLINALLFLWVILFIRHFIQEKNVKLAIQKPAIKLLSILIGIAILLVSTLICGHIILGMVADSKISFDVINFFTLNIYSVVGFVVLGCVAIGYFFLTQVIIYLLQPFLPKNILVMLLYVTLVGLAVLTIRLNEPDIIFDLCLLIWLLIYLLLLNNKQLFLLASQIISSRLIFWLFFFSLSITLIIILENDRKEVENRKYYVETLSIKADPASERLLNTVLTDFRSEALAPLFNKFKYESTNNLLKDSLMNANFSGYLNKYDTRIYTFDDREKPLFNHDSTNFNTLTTILKTQGKTTGIPGLYYYDLAYDRFTYICKKDISDSAERLLGYVFILATPKKYKTDALYPELFLRGYDNSIENSPVYSYALYKKLKLVYNHNDYAFPSKLTPEQVPKSDFETFRKNGYFELWYRSGLDKVVIMAKEDNFFIESITLFSYLFCAFLFVTGIFWFFNAAVRSRLRWSKMRAHWQMSIRNQVHATILFISLLSFFVVGIATVLFFINRYNNNNREKLSRTIRVMQNEMSNSLRDLIVYDDDFKIYDDFYRAKLEQTITRISEVYAVDVNVYDLDGDLKVSSLPLPYSKGIISNKMNPMAYYHLRQLKEIQFFKEESIGGLNYLSNYVPVIDESGREYAYLNIPYFTSQSKLRQEISNFLVAIINLNVFIFLIAGVVAFFITNRITRSFSFISNKMKEVNLGKENEAIKWTRNDEIGDLIKEYNKMVAKLDGSAAALAKSEREGAWREMARQVAHEIKNPLTPMKLSLQYLQKAINNNTGNLNELTKSVAATLVEQIDHLSQIAGQFSQFANIGNPRNEIFDLNETLKMTIQLHSLEEDVVMDWTPVNAPVLINADKTHINRLFTNLIQNASQAVPDTKNVHIKINEVIQQGSVLVTIKDNGNGIPENMRSKIFTPNFTTKTSGTGLGLAMCKGIIEQSKGDIWFETREGEGSTFYVRLPLANGV